jgi:hypothetical protein
MEDDGMNAEMFANRHISREELMDYVAELLPEEREAEIDLHLAACDDCAVTASQTRAMSVIWDNWTLRTHAEAHRQVRLAEILNQIPGLDAQQRGWLERWLQATLGRATAAARLILDAASQTAELVTEGLEAITLAASPWRLSLVGVQANQLSRGSATSTGRDLSQSAAPDVPQVSMQVGQAQPGGPWPILVRIEGLTREQQQANPRVLLIPTGVKAPPLARVPQAPSTPARSGSPSNVAFALFEEVPPGEYLVVVEPSGEGESESAAADDKQA